MVAQLERGCRGEERVDAWRDPERRAVDENRPFTVQAEVELGRLVPMAVQGPMRREVRNPEGHLPATLTVPSSIGRRAIAMTLFHAAD